MSFARKELLISAPVVILSDRLRPISQKNKTKTRTNWIRKNLILILFRIIQNKPLKDDANVFSFSEL
jgi:hypothetical protein